jgi:hypothetical protein
MRNNRKYNQETMMNDQLTQLMQDFKDAIARHDTDPATLATLTPLEFIEQGAQRFALWQEAAEKEGTIVS